MKKFYFLLMALMVSVAANAGSLYLVGGGTVDGKALPGSPNGQCVEVTSTTDTYTFEVENVTWLKISDTNATNWDTFNANGFVVEDVGDAVLLPNLTTTLYYGDGSNKDCAANINPPSKDKYTYTVKVGAKGTNGSTVTATPVGDVEIEYHVYVRGMNGNWDPTAENEMATEDGVIFTKHYDSITTSFKIADADWGAINYGFEGTFPINVETELAYNKDNITLAANVTDADLIFNREKHTLLVKTAAEVSYPEEMYVIGEVGDIAWNPTQGVLMNNEGDGIYTVENLKIKGGFALSTTLGANDGDWGTMNAGRMGPDNENVPAEIGENKVNGYGDGKSWTLTPGYYSLTFDYTEKILEIEEGEAPELVVPEAIYMRGNGNWEDNTDAIMPLVKEGDEPAMTQNGEYQYKAKFDKIEGEFKFASDAKSWDNLIINYGASKVTQPADGETLEAIANGQNFNAETALENVNVTFFWNPNSDLGYVLFQVEATEEPEPEPQLGLVKVYQFDNAYVPAASGDARLGTGYNGTIYINDKAKKQVIALDKDGNSTVFATGGAGVGIATDDAGNMVVSNAWAGARAANDFIVISADGKTTQPISIDMPEGVTAARTDLIGRATGDFFSAEGGRFYLAIPNNDRVVAVDIKNGGKDFTTTASHSFTAPTLNNQPIAVPVGDNFAVRARSAGNGTFYLSDGTTLTALPQSGAKLGANEGGDIFVLGGKMYQVVPSNINAPVNYSNEFTFYDEEGQVIETVILGGETPTVSTSMYVASVTARTVSDTQAEIYLVGVAPQGVSYAMYTYTIEATVEPEPEEELVGTYDIYMQEVADFEGNLEGEPFEATIEVYKKDSNYYIKNENFVANIPFNMMADKAQLLGDAENDPMSGVFLMANPLAYQGNYLVDYDAETGFNFIGQDGSLLGYGWFNMKEDYSVSVAKAYLLMNELPAEELEPATYSDRVFGEKNGVDYYLEYTVVRNADSTLDIAGTYVFPKDKPDGAVDFYHIVIPGVYTKTDLKDGEAATTDGKFEDGKELEITFQKPIAGGLIEEKVIYTVGNEQEMPEMPAVRPDVPDYEDGVELAAKNVYAYDIKVTPYVGDNTQAVIQYRLNGKTKSVSIQALLDGEPIEDAVFEGTTEEKNSVDVALPAGDYNGELTFAITATPEVTVETPTLVVDNIEGFKGYYSFWSPTTIAVNNNPESSTFGRALTVENRYHATPFGNSSYHAYQRGAAVYAFDPQMVPVKAEDGKVGFQLGLNVNTETQIYGDFMDLRFINDGRLFFATTDLTRYGIYEIDPEDMDATAQPMFDVAKDHNVWAFDAYTYADGSTKFVMAESLDQNAGQSNGVTAARIMIYDLDDNGYLVNGKRIAEGYSFPNGLGMKVRIDPDGQGFYVSSHRGDAVETEPHMIHSDFEGNLDVNDYQNTYNCGAMGYNHDNTLFARVEGNATVVVYRLVEAAAVAEEGDENGEEGNKVTAPVMEKLTSFNAGIGNPIMAIAFDYANNIFVSGNNQEKFQQFQLPAEIAGASTTVNSPSKYAITLDSGTNGVGNVAVDAEDANAVYYNINGVRMPANAKLPAGVYVKVVGKTATKVVVR